MQFSQTFAEDLALILESGGTLEQGISSILENSNCSEAQPILERLLVLIRSGQSLDQAVRTEPSVFPPIASNLIRAGEQSGNLSASLLLLAQQLDKQEKLRAKVSNALIYPTVLLIVLTLSMLGLLIFVIPNFASLFSENEVQLTFSMRALLAVSDFLISYGFFFLVGLSVLILLARYKYGWRLKESIVLLFRQSRAGSELIGLSEGAKFCRCMASLLQGGIDQPNSLLLAADLYESALSKERVIQAAEHVKNGITLSESLRETSVLPRPYLSSLGNAEKAGKLAYSFELIGNRMEANFDRRVQTMTKLAEPALVVFMGLIIGLVVYAVFGSMQNISNLSF